LKTPLQLGQALQPAVAKPDGIAPGESKRLRLLAICVITLVLCFAKPLLDLVRFALASELYSYILLVPFISGYLIWSNRYDLALYSEPVRARAIPAFVVGCALLLVYRVALGFGWRPSVEAYLGLMMLSLIGFLVSAAFFCLGAETIRRVAFPATLLIFIIPLPDPLLQAIVTFLQHGSADVASGLLTLSGMPFLRNDTSFQLPGMPLEVAPECSGIRSTLVLFITSLIAGYLFLRSPWRRAILTVAVVPLALLRNGFRVFTIGQLCVQIGPQMIHSPIHRRGGPLFFALSLIPFFLLLLWMRKRERRGML
jgi:exosortase C (VPDSG-CTERM-specific)